MSKFFNQLNNIKAGRAKVRAYGEGGTVDALESARDYLREKYNNPEAGIPTKVATVLGLLPVNLARGFAKAVSAPARSMTDENFNPEEEAANMAGFITTGGIGLSNAGLGPKGDVLGMGVGKRGNLTVDAYNNAKWNDGSHPGQAANVDEFDFNFPNGVSAALGEELKKVKGLKVSNDFATEGNSMYREVELPNGETLKIRVSDHANTAANRNAPDFNLAPGGSHNFEEVVSSIQSKVDKAWKDVKNILMKDPDSWDVPDWAVEEFRRRGTIDPTKLDITKASGGAVHQRALGAKLFGLK